MIFNARSMVCCTQAALSDVFDARCADGHVGRLGQRMLGDSQLFVACQNAFWFILFSVHLQGKPVMGCLNP